MQGALRPSLFKVAANIRTTRAQDPFDWQCLSGDPASQSWQFLFVLRFRHSFFPKNSNLHVRRKAKLNDF
jgi:hypothetical protein